MVRAPDLKSVGRGFKSRSDHYHVADVVLGSPEFNFSSTLVNSQLVCLPPVGFLNQVMFIYHYLFTLALGSSQLRIHLHLHTSSCRSRRPDSRVDPETTLTML